MPPADAPSPRTRVRRLAERGAYDRDVVHAILDEALVAHVGMLAPHGPVVLPMTYARLDDTLYLHGAAANALLGGATDAAVCVTVTLLDGLVLARSMFHHSMNYRSVVIFGTGRRVSDAAECRAASFALTDKMWPGRSREARGPSDVELKATRFVAVPLGEASAKIRTGPPKDDDDDMLVDAWAGVVPIASVLGPSMPDAYTRVGRELPPRHPL